ncbi:MAG: translocation/assembly module TamB domain-containing protein [Polyangiaceae bacterium]
MPSARPLRAFRDWGRLVARLFCAVFALIGALPLAAGVLTRTDWVLDWASSETRRVLAEQLGVEARYRVSIDLWPLAVALNELELPASDGGTPVLAAKRVAVHPRIFSLLAGRLDAGEIEIDEPDIRLVVENGEIRNLKYRLPKREGPAPEMQRAPFSSLGITDARLSLRVDNVRVNAFPVDVDIFAEGGPSFEIAVRGGETQVTRARPVTVEAAPGEASVSESVAPRSITFDAMDEDVICRTELRARAEPGALLLRRLSLLGRADADPNAGTTPECAKSGESDPLRVALRLSQVRVEFRKGEVPLIDGHVVARAPAVLANRFEGVPPLFGWAAFAGDLRFDGRYKLPELRGKVRGAGLGLDVYHLAKTLSADVEVSQDVIRIARFDTEFAEGRISIKNSEIRPMAKGVPMTVERLDGTGVTFPALMRDLGVTENTIIGWDLDKTHVSGFGGTLHPLRLDGNLTAETKNFEVYDRSYKSTSKRHMIGVHNASVRGKVGVRPTALQFYDIRTSFGKSAVLARMVSIGFKNDIHLDISKGSKIDLSDVSPLVDIPWAGQAELNVTMKGKSGNPLLTGDLAVAKLEFGGFPIGDIKSGKVKFQPLKVDFTDVVGKKGKSEFRVPTARLNFDTDSAVLTDARVVSERFDIRDFFAMFLFDKDPRFDPIIGSGKVDATVHYDLGGKRDRCGGGLLKVAGDLDFGRLELFEERYDGGKAEFDFRWFDRDASYQGIELDVPSIKLTKGPGVILGSFAMQPGARIAGHLVATGVPVSRIEAMGRLAPLVDATGSGTAEVSGTIDDMVVHSQVHVSPLRVGTKTLPSSDVSVVLEPKRRPVKVIGKTRCGGAITPAFDRAKWEQDESMGTFYVSGKALGGQVRMSRLAITRQRQKRLSGALDFVKLDVGGLAELSPSVALAQSKPSGTLSGSLAIEKMDMERAAESRMKLVLSELALERGGLRMELLRGSKPLAMRDGKLEIQNLGLAVISPRGQRGVFDVRGSVAGLNKTPTVSAELSLRPVELASFVSDVPRIERAKGRLAGKLSVSGPIQGLRYRGGFRLQDGELVVRGLPSSVSNLNVALDVDGDELRLTRATAQVGNGSVSISGAAPLRGFELGAARAAITLRELALPLQSGMRATVDGNLVATWQPGSDAGPNRTLPRLTGNVTVRSFEYTRPITMTADINALGQRGKRTEFEAYDPSDDYLALDLTIRATRALAIRNNLVDAELSLGSKGLELSGTNQRFGLRGEVQVKPGGRIRLRRSEFEVRSGTVRFDDRTRIAPQVDLRATTEYRRYSDASGAKETSGSTDGASSGGAAAQGGRWLITMHAYGDAENLRIDMTSDPALAQDDIFLLLTVGLTRAELDQAQSASVGESVALEALGTLTGADRAVSKALPVIDEFRFGSAYSSRTGRTEPTVTIGKRLAERIRANVTSGLADSREIRSNLEWRLSPRVSVEGSYDNVNDISSSSLGNLGADIRWRLEFE